jgi:hypothetical protein
VLFVRLMTVSSCFEHAQVFWASLFLPEISNQNSSTSDDKARERQINFEEKPSKIQLAVGSWAIIVNGVVASTPTILQICPESSQIAASYISMERDIQELLPIPTKCTTVDLVIHLCRVEMAGKEKAYKVYDRSSSRRSHGVPAGDKYGSCICSHPGPFHPFHILGDKQGCQG